MDVPPFAAASLRAATVAKRAAEESAEIVLSVPKMCSAGFKVRVTYVLDMTFQDRG